MLFQLAAAQKRTDLCHECRFRLGLGGFQLFRFDFFPYFVKLPFRLLLLGLQLPHVGFKLSRLPFQVTVVWAVVECRASEPRMPRCKPYFAIAAA